MRFDASVSPYMKGTAFSNGLRLRIANPETSVPDRLAVLDSLLTAKRVIHVGCCDHVPLIRQKLAADTWLHARISRIAVETFGVDTSAEGIEMMRDELGYEKVACADITRDTIPGLLDGEWDFMVLGELLEHLDDPVGFLRAVADRYRTRVARIVITVPNAFSLLNVRHSLRHQEFINTDHRHWLSPYTLGRMLTSAGLEPEGFEFCELFPRNEGWRDRMSVRAAASSFLLRRFPALREGLIMTARI